MPRDEVTIQTRDGACPAFVFRPSGAGPWPGVLVYMDGIGIRSALSSLCERIAGAGYLALLPDLFYRAGPYQAPDPKLLFTDVAFRQEWGAKFRSTATIANAMSDTAAFLDWLAARADLRGGKTGTETGKKIGTVGYCMGGAISLSAAGTFPDRVGAAASFHGANLATDAPDSPHLLAPKMRGAKIYVAGAVEDASFPDDMKRRLDDALTAAGVDHRVETYAGLRHGWVPSDTPVHDPEGAERHFRALFELLAAANLG